MGDSNSTGSIEPQTSIVVYRKETGEIVSTHHFGATRGVELPEQAELERIALAHVQSDHEDLTELATVAVSSHEVRVRTPLIVSVEDRRIIAVETDESSA